MIEINDNKSVRHKKSLDERWICLDCIKTNKQKFCIDCHIELTVKNAAPEILQIRRLSGNDKKNLLCISCAEKEWEGMSNTWGLE